jgi:branched-chain amino acid transport system substrate-binding protein
MKKFFRILIVFSFLLAVLLTGCAEQKTQSTSKNSNSDKITIGASVSLNGKYSNGGKLMLNGYQLAIEQINKKGGILGKKVELKYYDDESDVNTVKKLYEKLITGDKVDLTLAPFSSALTQAALTVTEKYGYALVAPAASDSKLFTQGYKGIVSLYPPAKNWYNNFMELLAQHGYKKIAILEADLEQSHAIADGVKQQIKKLGLDLVYEETFTPGTTDYSSMISKIKNSNADVFFNAAYLEDEIQIVRQMKSNNYAPKILVQTEGPNKIAFHDALGKDANFVAMSQIFYPGAAPGSQEFVDAYKKKYNEEPQETDSVAYAAVQILEEGIKKANSIDNAKLINTLKDLKMTTIIGKWGVTKTGEVNVTNINYLQYQDGKKVLIYPKNIAQSELKEMPAWSKR